MKYGKNEVGNYNVMRGNIMKMFESQAFVYAETHNIAIYDDIEGYDFIDRFVVDKMNLFEMAREGGVRLLTDKGYVYGHFVGTIGFPVDSDPVPALEDRTLAFKTENGQIVSASKGEDEHWHLTSLKEYGAYMCEIYWDEYPEDWKAIWTRPECIRKPAEKKSVKLTDFVDKPWRTDCGEFLYVVKSRCYCEELYAGHNRKIAAKEMKEARTYGDEVEVTVYPVHRQNEYAYDELPF